MSIDMSLKQAVSHGGIYLVRYYNGRTQQSIERATPLTGNLHQVECSRLLAVHGVDIEDAAADLSVGEPIRVMVNDVCASVFRNDHHYLVISYAKGHVIVKSLKRIGRRTLKAIVKAHGLSGAVRMGEAARELHGTRPLGTE